MATTDLGKRLWSIGEIAALVDDTEAHIQEFIREDRIAYVACPDGILIPVGAFQVVMPDLYDLGEDLRALAS